MQATESETHSMKKMYTHYQLDCAAPVLTNRLRSSPHHTCSVLTGLSVLAPQHLIFKTELYERK